MSIVKTIPISIKKTWRRHINWNSQKKMIDLRKLKPFLGPFSLISFFIIVIFFFFFFKCSFNGWKMAKIKLTLKYFSKFFCLVCPITVTPSWSCCVLFSDCLDSTSIPLLFPSLLISFWLVFHFPFFALFPVVSSYWKPHKHLHKYSHQSCCEIQRLGKKKIRKFKKKKKTAIMFEL